jgi:hypothetical protein
VRIISEIDFIGDLLDISGRSKEEGERKRREEGGDVFLLLK